MEKTTVIFQNTSERFMKVHLTMQASLTDEDILNFIRKHSPCLVCFEDNKFIISVELLTLP